jgi:hypothetical protein
LITLKLKPPFKPEVASECDTRFMEPSFLEQSVSETPANAQDIVMEEDEFAGFSVTKSELDVSRG